MNKAKPDSKIWTEMKRAIVWDWISFWVKQLSLEPVNLDVDFFDNGHTDDGSNTICMDIESGFPYRRMYIRVFPVMADMDNRRIGQKTCHELMHYVVKPMDRYRLAEPQYFSDQQEVVVEQLAMCFENLTHFLDKERKRNKELEKKLSASLKVHKAIARKK